MKHSNIFITLMALVFVALVVVFNFLPRPTFSEVERRELATLPEFSTDKLADGSLAREISSWFSDTEPFREDFMTLNMKIKDAMGISSPFDKPDDAIVFHASDDDAPQADNEDAPQRIAPKGTDSNISAHKAENDTSSLANEYAKMASKGILVVGQAPNVRALMVYGGAPSSGARFAESVSQYKAEFPNLNVYCMVVPNAIEFYCPEKAKSINRSQLATINYIYGALTNGAKGIDVYTPLQEHADEDIFLRTDHHWAPRGAYYGAKAFAQAAGVPFQDLSTYTENVVHGYVGSMYGYSKDISVKNSPEDFVYYTPNGVDYNTTYIVYNVDKNMRITGRSRPHRGQFFIRFRDGSGGAYCTFMGGDTKITQVRTSTHNGRRLVIIKDSFGNALPGYLFHSFEEIHVIDCRYFQENMHSYVKDNGITDILFVNNIFMIAANRPLSNYQRFLTQNGTLERVEHAAKPDSSAQSKAKEQKAGIEQKAAEEKKSDEKKTDDKPEAAPMPTVDDPPTTQPEAPASQPEVPVSDPTAE